MKKAEGFYVLFYCTNERSKNYLRKKTQHGRAFYVVGVASRQNNKDADDLMKLFRSPKKSVKNQAK